jgi:hypothetical protein
VLNVAQYCGYSKGNESHLGAMIKSRRMRLAGYVARIVAKRIAYRILVGKPEGKRQLGRQRRRWGSIKLI